MTFRQPQFFVEPAHNCLQNNWPFDKAILASSLRMMVSNIRTVASRQTNEHYLKAARQGEGTLAVTL
ncbi:hypothetical protein ACP87_01400 [Pseudomonas oleovorans]|nr:hypothetical protein [Pseudomonas oleovorans]MBN7133694.1 hypothetical protein [Pseudomonas oleovorans]MBN7139102.1 hypothetical protein [Pseudomonas oleovorans]